MQDIPQKFLQADDVLAHWLALSFIPGIGPARFFQLLKIFQNIADVFRASTPQLSALGLSATIIDAIKRPDWKKIAQHLQWAEQPNCHIITYDSPHYPVLLSHIAVAPPVLFVQGDLTVLQSQQLAVVGSRNPSPNGVDIARQFSSHLANIGLTITSGLALGVDAASHSGALQSRGKTIAVLGTGLDCIYPRANKGLAAQILEQGALVSEYALGTSAKPENFPRRNRIICGLSLGVLVIEATMRSGSLITARLAVEQGREVFAVPGSIHNPLAKGCHDLIRQGAKLVETTQDILDEIGFSKTALQADYQVGSGEKNVDDSNIRPLSKQNILLEFEACERPEAQFTDGVNEHRKREHNEAIEQKMQFRNRSILEIDATSQAILANIGFEHTTIDQLMHRTGQNAQVISSALVLLELKGYVASVPEGGHVRIGLFKK